MKHYLPNSLRALFLSLGVLLSLPMLAEKVEIDGINYDLNADTKQATVVAKSSGKYSGSIVIPESVEHESTAYSVTIIGGVAFNGCSGLTSVTIPNSVESIGSSAFSDCSGLTSVTIGNSVTSIGDYAFHGCSGLTSVTIPNSVTSIGESAFHSCSGLTSVTIPNSVTSIGEWAFYDCSGLSSIVVEDGNPVYDSRNNCNAIIETVTNTLHFGCKTTIIPNSVTSIGGAAFFGCSGLTSVTIPNSVTSIGLGAFSHCSGLTSVTIGNSVTSIGSDAFFNCFGLTSVTIPNSVTSIGRTAFGSCSGLTSVTIGNSVESIRYDAFGSCSNLHDVYCYAENVPSTDSDAFVYSPIADATLHVPAASINNYKATAPWSDFGSIVALPGQYSLTVSSVGYATLYLDFNAEIPEGVKAYVAKEVVDSRLKMELVEGVLPANTGVIIMAEEGTYAFVKSNKTPAVIEKNLLKGTVEKKEITAEANTSYYVLSAPDGAVAMYLALLTENKFWNNANKAYLPINYGDLGIFDDEVDSSVEQLSRRLVFDFDDETGIAETKIGNVKSENSAIFDLSGRRVQKAQKGIFIRDGKVVVK